MKKIISILLSVMVLAFLPLASYAAAAVEDGNGGFIITDGTSLDGYWSDRELQTALFEGTYGIANNFPGTGPPSGALHLIRLTSAHALRAVMLSFSCTCQNRTLS